MQILVYNVNSRIYEYTNLLQNTKSKISQVKPTKMLCFVLGLQSTNVNVGDRHTNDENRLCRKVGVHARKTETTGKINWERIREK